LTFPWNFFTGYFGRESLNLPSGDQDDAGQNIVYGWMQPKSEYDDVKVLKDGGTVKVDLSTSGFSKKTVRSQNVVGVLEGSDPVLKDEYILLSAHYDHVGVGAEGDGAYTEQDSIFNGTRDNGIGSIAMVATAKALGQKPPKRSVIYFACTGEEKGLLGSQYYAENPLVPLEKTVFNLNIDNGGYNDTSIVTIIGYGRTGTDEAVQEASQRYGLEAISDPAPEQGLFDRSDNVSFAVKGVPCLSFSMGFTAFDAEIMKYYHQVTDNPDNVDYDYIQKYAQAYAHLARKIADAEGLPFWIEGDKYEAAGKALYKK
jgi:Zn-dependent M28 family amino/carboxypeptidase